ncbi:MAG: glycosyltransferase family 2 protein [Candidatus Marinimicrobia bacterium]|nr:glycosyltransferase family 2 protein [Candidatus Neomarinimicrobiota bacterium]MDD5582146.1 glycosyltransferase family 2 protein [Candidatus Neomarinimicrobiota bacterium]
MSEISTYPLSAAIIVKNEAHNIQRCLESIRWIEDIVVFDTGSTDETVDLCQKFGCRVFEGEWKGFGPAKQFAVSQTKYDWVFVIDADEVASPELSETIRTVIMSPQAHGYRIRRLSYYLGKQIRHSGWNRDYTLRLFHKAHGFFNDKLVHEFVQIPSGKIEKIESPLYHFTYPDVNTHIRKIMRYTDLAAESAIQQGSRATLAGAFFRGIFKFLKMYLFQAGFLDGEEGFILSSVSSFGVFMKYVKIARRSQQKTI